MKAIEASFEVELPGGKTVQLNLMQHKGLKTMNMPIKAKLITCPENFADKHSLENHGLTETCPNGQHRCVQQSAPLSIILGADVGHVHPILQDSFEDQHGYLSLYQDRLSGAKLVAGNCRYPYSVQEVKQVLAEQTGNFGATVDFSDEEDGDLPTVTLYHSATGSSLLPENLPIATRMDQGRGTLEFLHKPTTGISQLMLPEINKDGDSEEEPQRMEARKRIQIQEVNKFLSAGVLSPDLH